MDFLLLLYGCFSVDSSFNRLNYVLPFVVIAHLGQSLLSHTETRCDAFSIIMYRFLSITYHVDKLLEETDDPLFFRLL